jgi:hypothetical protein
MELLHWLHQEQVVVAIVLAYHVKLLVVALVVGSNVRPLARVDVLVLVKDLALPRAQEIVQELVLMGVKPTAPV